MSKARPIRVRAMRDFLLALVVFSALAGLFVYFLVISSLPYPWKGGTVILIIVVWLVAVVGFLSNLKRDLTAMVFGDAGLGVGQKIIPYKDISAVDARPGKPIFRLSLKGRRSDAYLSKIGIASEEEFFAELDRRIRQ